MAENPSPSMLPQPGWVSQVLALLSALVQTEGATLSIYTSRKGRVWVTFKTHTPHTYTTSAEVRHGDNLLALLRSLGVAGWAHMYAVHGYNPKQDTWCTAQDLDDTWDDIQAALMAGALPVSPAPEEVAQVGSKDPDNAIADIQGSAPVQPVVDTPSSIKRGSARRKEVKD